MTSSYIENDQLDSKVLKWINGIKNYPIFVNFCIDPDIVFSNECTLPVNGSGVTEEMKTTLVDNIDIYHPEVELGNERIYLPCPTEPDYENPQILEKFQQKAAKKIVNWEITTGFREEEMGSTNGLGFTTMLNDTKEFINAILDEIDNLAAEYFLTIRIWVSLKFF